jgi:hypothetical protein
VPEHLPTGRYGPFTQAFLNNIDKAEPLTIVLQDISADTYRLSGSTQSPRLSGAFRTNPRYSLKPPTDGASSPPRNTT